MNYSFYEGRLLVPPTYRNVIKKSTVIQIKLYSGVKNLINLLIKP